MTNQRNHRVTNILHVVVKSPTCIMHVCVCEGLCVPPNTPLRRGEARPPSSSSPPRPLLCAFSLIPFPSVLLHILHHRGSATTFALCSRRCVASPGGSLFCRWSSFARGTAVCWKVAVCLTSDRQSETEERRTRRVLAWCRRICQVSAML